MKFSMHSQMESNPTVSLKQKQPMRAHRLFLFLVDNNGLVDLGADTPRSVGILLARLNTRIR